MAMSISGSSSASSVKEGCWVVDGLGAEVGLGMGEAMVGRCGDAVRAMQCSCCQKLSGWKCKSLGEELLMCHAAPASLGQGILLSALWRDCQDFP